MPKTITDGARKLKFGRSRPKVRCPRLSLRNYLLKKFPTPPSTADYTKPPAQYLARILGNDALGDCTAAGAFHIGGTLLANAGAAIPFKDEDVIKFYSATTGYVPGDDSTDQGGDEQTVLNYWTHHGLLPNAHKIQGWIAVDGNDPAELRAAIWLFENIYFGVELPDAWVNPMPNPGFTWDAAGDPVPENGHCFVGLGYDGSTITIDTWGMLGKITDKAIAKYATTTGQGELYTVLGPDAISKATKKAPNGFDWSQLCADLESMKG